MSSSLPPSPNDLKSNQILQGIFGSKMIHRALKERFKEMNFKPEDESKINLDNLNSLTEAELLYFENKYIQDNFPTWRIWLVVGYHIPMTLLSYAYLKNFSRIKKRFFPSYLGKKGVGSMIKLGTYHALGFSFLYFTGLLISSGVYHPIKYLKGLFAIQGRIADINLRFDPTAQEIFLISNLRYFELKEETIQKIREELEEKKAELEKQNFFLITRKELENIKNDL